MTFPCRALLPASLALCLSVFGAGAARAADEGPKIRPATQKEAPTDANLEEAFARANADAKAQRAKWKGKSFEEFERSVYREPFEGGKYIVNGDIAIPDRAQLEAFFRDYIQRDPARLIVHTVNGQDAVWGPGEKQKISYCVSKGFGSRYAAVVAEMNAASGAWEAVALVDFVHVPAEDASCTASNAKVVFDVRPVNEGQYLARAFFPNEARPGRNVLIDESSFGLDPAGKLQLVGILRHELGHTLGLRHEQTRPESGTCFEDTNWRPLTEYDAFSVMHYPQCNGGGDWSLVLTDQDKHGVACLYGAASGTPFDAASCPSTPPSAVSGAPANP
jgi:serine protease